MQEVNMLKARSSNFKHVKAIKQGREQEIVIASNSRTAARLVAIEVSPPEKRIGTAKGLFVVPEGINKHDAEVAALFAGEAPF
jgi:antitoxin (DNA-binding transcriptional repressor) of toxin-antitoxin stability system